MAAPPKPWERPGTNFQNSSSLPSSTMSAPIGSDSVQRGQGCCPSPSISAPSNPPRVPPRPSSQQSSFSSQPALGYSSLGGYGSYSSPMGYGGYGGMYSSPYSSFGNYGSYGGYNRMGDVQSSFARHAEESSRPAFESIHSIVNAVNAVGMMLDSTFQAVYNSFRAVIGVADNFTRLKTQLLQVFSALAFIRTLRYMYRRLLEMLWLKPRGEADRQWMEAFEAAAASATAGPGGVPKKSSWPILLFFGIIMGGPYLIWKLISALSASSPDEEGWMSGLNDHFVARATYNFQGQGSDELSFSAGQNINIAPKDLQPRVRGWLLASVDGKSSGMIPANYVTVLGKRRGTKTSSQPLPSSQQAENTSSVSPALSNMPQQIASIQENELDSVFSGASLPSTDMAATPAPSSQDLSDSSNRDASDILNDVDKGS